MSSISPGGASDEVTCIVLVTYLKRLRRTIIEAFSEKFLVGVDAKDREIETVASEVDLVLVIRGKREDVYGRVFSAASSVLEYYDGLQNVEADPRGVEIFMLDSGSTWNFDEIPGGMNGAYVVASCLDGIDVSKIADDLARYDHVTAAAPIAGRRAVFVKVAAPSKTEFDRAIIGTRQDRGAPGQGHQGIQGHAHVHATRTLVLLREPVLPVATGQKLAMAEVLAALVNPKAHAHERLQAAAYVAYPDAVKATAFDHNHGISESDPSTLPESLVHAGNYGVGRQASPLVKMKPEFVERINVERRVPKKA